MTSDAIALHLTPREVALLLRYACPFEEHGALLRAAKPRAGWCVIHIEPFWSSMWIGDLVHSAKKTRSAKLLDELDSLCDVLENAERLGTIRGRS